MGNDYLTSLKDEKKLLFKPQYYLPNQLLCHNCKTGEKQKSCFHWAGKKSEALEPRLWLIAAGAYPGFCSMKRLEVFLLPLDRMLVHRRSLPRNFVGFPQQIAGTHLYTWVERGTVRVKCLAQEHNTLSPARARTWTARSGVERTNHAATAQAHVLYNMSNSEGNYGDKNPLKLVTSFLVIYNSPNK